MCLVRFCIWALFFIPLCVSIEEGNAVSDCSSIGDNSKVAFVGDVVAASGESSIFGFIQLINTYLREHGGPKNVTNTYMGVSIPRGNTEVKEDRTTFGSLRQWWAETYEAHDETYGLEDFTHIVLMFGSGDVLSWTSDYEIENKKLDQANSKRLEWNEFYTARLNEFHLYIEAIAERMSNKGICTYICTPTLIGEEAHSFVHFSGQIEQTPHPFPSHGTKGVHGQVRLPIYTQSNYHAILEDVYGILIETVRFVENANKLRQKSETIQFSASGKSAMLVDIFMSMHKAAESFYTKHPKISSFLEHVPYAHLNSEIMMGHFLTSDGVYLSRAGHSLVAHTLLTSIYRIDKKTYATSPLFDEVEWTSNSKRVFETHSSVIHHMVEYTHGVPSSHVEKPRAEQQTSDEEVEIVDEHEEDNDVVIEEEDFEELAFDLSDFGEL